MRLLAAEREQMDIEETLTEIISHGLVRGLGRPEPGELCVEAAICLALGEHHSDSPSCVADPDRQFGVLINDAEWSSDQVRADALLPLALAQLGTAGTDRRRWACELALLTVQRVLPLALRAVGLDEHAAACERAATLEEAARTANAARSAARSAYYAANAARSAAFAVADADRSAANAAAYAAVAASYYAINAAVNAADSAYYASYYAINAADSVAASASASASANAAASAVNDPDRVLRLSVECALEAYARAGEGEQ